MTTEREEALHDLERRLGYRFADLDLLDRALTHASRANEEPSPGRGDNEALEFLGDAVLELVVTDLLHRRDPDGAEGLKSQRRARLVSAPSLAGRAEELGLGELLLLGRGEEKTGGRQKSALWANAYE
ncbi:MAG: ribonuclease III domain-containing protein, partial [Vicinamibacteria bacterium]